MIAPPALGRVPLIVVLCFVAGVAAVALGSLSAFSFVFWVGAMVACGLVAVWWSVRTQQDLLSPLSLTALFYVLTFAAGAVYCWFNPSIPGYNSKYLGDHATLPAAVELGVVAFVMF